MLYILGVFRDALEPLNPESCSQQTIVLSRNGSQVFWQQNKNVPRATDDPWRALIAYPPPSQYLFINFCSRWLILLLRDFTVIGKL